MKVPFRNLLVFPNQVPWPGRLENSTLSENLDAGRTREIQTNYDRLPHFCSRCDCLYQMNEKNCKGEFEKGGSLLSWCPKAVRRTPRCSGRGSSLAPPGAFPGKTYIVTDSTASASTLGKEQYQQQKQRSRRTSPLLAKRRSTRRSPGCHSSRFIPHGRCLILRAFLSPLRGWCGGRGSDSHG